MPSFRASDLSDRKTWDTLAAGLKTDTVLQKFFDDLTRIPDTRPAPTAADYLAAKRSNDRSRLDDHWRKTRPRQTLLVVNRAMKGLDEKDLDDRLLNWIFAATYEPTWVVSAHLPNNDLPLSGRQQLDLAGCEMAMEMAESREVLLPWLKSVSKTLDESIVNEVDRRCLKPFGDGVTEWWCDFSKPETNNWAGVCGGSLLTACESLAAQGFDRPAARKRALDVMRYFLAKGFTESGECDEGIGYWSYGVEFACLGLSRLGENALKTEIDQKRLAAVASFPGRAHLTGKLFFAGNDSASLASAPWCASWLSDVTGDPFLAWWYQNYFSGDVRTVPQLLRYLSQSSRTEQKLQSPIHPASRYLPDQQVAIFQQQTKKGLISFTITGGNNGENHNHNDLGTFQFFLDEQPLIPDLGAPHYTTDFFTAARYKKFIVASSSGHCCPSVNGIEQREGKAAAAKVIGYDEKNRSLHLDLTAAYPPEAKLKKWTRKATMAEDGNIQLIDEFDLASGEIVHRIWFADEPKVTADGIVETKQLHLSLSPKPAKIEVHPFLAGDERLNLRMYPKDRKIFRVDATYSANAGKVKVETMIQLT